MRIIKIFFYCHIAALVLVLCGLMLLAPHSAFWPSDPAWNAFGQGIVRAAGALQILFGAATMFFFGWLYVGPRQTLIFFSASLLTALLLGWLMVSKTLPPGVFAPEIVSQDEPGVLFMLLAWFYMGFTSYLVACKLVLRLGLSWPTFWSLVSGTYFVMAWAAALKAALDTLQVHAQSSVLHLYGSAFGMPISNGLSWMLLCLILLCVIQLLWRDKPDVRSLTIGLPFGVYTVNMAFVMVLSFGIGLWFSLILSALFVLAPEALAFYPREDVPAAPGGRLRASLSQAIWLLMRCCALLLARRQIKLRVEGLEHIPRRGSVLIAARHFHYFYDGYVLVRVLPRRLHIIVALDWLQVQGLRLLIELACRLADWPVILRGTEMKKHTNQGRWVYQSADGRRYLRQVMQTAARLLRAGEVLVIFPEGHPNLDPHPTPKADLDAFLPFQPGFIRMAERAQKDGHTRVAIVPTGLAYTREQGNTWLVRVSFGPALFLEDFASSNELLHTVEERVQALSYASSFAVSEYPEGTSRS